MTTNPSPFLDRWGDGKVYPETSCGHEKYLYIAHVTGAGDDDRIKEIRCCTVDFPDPDDPTFMRRTDIVPPCPGTRPLTQAEVEAMVLAVVDAAEDDLARALKDQRETGYPMTLDDFSNVTEALASLPERTP